MDAKEVFAHLRKQKKSVLLDYLRAAFDEMTAKQRQAVFADALRARATSVVDGDQLREEIERFRRDSLARKYYAPFNTNSKNYREIPAKTAEWCDSFARFVAGASALTARGYHAQAVACFAMLYELLEALERGKEIIFAEEAGSWLIPADHKAWLESYLTSLAATATAEQFTAAVLPMVKRDSRHSFADRVHASARRVANSQQKAHLAAELRRQNVPTEPAP